MLKYYSFIAFSILYFILLLFILFKFKLYELNSGTPFILGLIIFSALYLLLYKYIDNKLKKDNFVMLYKNNIISEFIKIVLPNFIYTPSIDNFTSSNLISEYKSANFDYKTFNQYYIDDYISGSLNNSVKINIFDLNTIYKYKRDNQRYEETIFSGQFANIKLDYLSNFDIKIINKQKDRLIRKENIKSKINLDDSTFNEYFAVTSNSSLNAYELLTSDVMEFLYDQYFKNHLEFDLSINQGNIYIRIHSSPIFEPSIFKNTINKKDFERFYNMLNFIIGFLPVFNNMFKDSNL